MPRKNMSSFQITKDFENSGDYYSFFENFPVYFEDACEETIVRHCLIYGTNDGLGVNYPPSSIKVTGPEMREHFQAGGFSSRQRATIEELYKYILEHSLSPNLVKIHGHEAITNLALFLRGRFPKYLGTEYAKNDKEKEFLWPIPHADVCNLYFFDNQFDLVISGDVLEHVPDIDAALREIYRVLHHGGRFIGTFPFLSENEQSIRRAEIRGGDVVHFFDPIYHGNPLDPEAGSLVFELPGWDILDRARSAGFSRAVMRLVIDQQKGIVASELGRPIRPRGVFVAIFDKM